MSVPNTNTFSFWDVCNEIYGSHSAGMNLVQCFADATGTFDSTYVGSRNSLLNFRNYQNKITVTDIDGNVYDTVKIGNQIWTTTNFKAYRYNDGSLYVLHGTPNQDWLAYPSFTWLDNVNYEATAGRKLGRLYNFYAVNQTNFAPIGWHVPSKTEVETLINTLGGSSSASAALRGSVNNGGSNSSGFNALDSGFYVTPGYYFGGTVANSGYAAFAMWIKTVNGSQAYALQLGNNLVSEILLNSESMGFSVRLIKD